MGNEDLASKSLSVSDNGSRFIFVLDCHKQFYKQNGSRITSDQVYICFIPLDMFQHVLRPKKRPIEQAVFISFVLCVTESSKSESLSAKQTC